MSTLALGPQSPHTWPAFTQMVPVTSPPPHFHAQQHGMVASPFAFPPIRPRNDIDFDRQRLITILEYLSQLLATSFEGRPFRLVVHGGACMLLHPRLYELSLQQHRFLPDLPHRTTTRDVDYLHRSFIIEMAQLKVPNAAAKLKECIMATAQKFNLGADWMNSDADIALPMATAPNGVTYDPIYHASVQPNNIELHTIYRSSNGMLTLISVTPFWAVSLKLVRYSKQDAADISLLLRNGTLLSQTKWSVETLREWLFANCWAMGYAQYDVQRLHKLNERLNHAIQTIAQWTESETVNPNSNLAESAWSSVNVAFTPPADRRVSPLAAMGGGDVVGGEHGQNGWKATWPRGPSGFMQPSGRYSQGNSLNPTPHGTPPEAPFVQSDDKTFVHPYFADPADFTIARQSQDMAAAAARKARKKAKALKSNGQSSQILSPPPSYHSTVGYHGSRPTSPWGFYPPQPPDQHGPGLSSLQGLDESLGQMLQSQYNRPPQTVPGMYHYAPNPTSTHPPISSSKKSEKSRKKEKREKEKRKKEKEKEKERQRERDRANKWLAPREHGSPVNGDSESDLEDEDDSDEDSGYDYSPKQRGLSHPDSHGSWPPYPPQQVNPQAPAYSSPLPPYVSGSPPKDRSSRVSEGQVPFIPPIPTPVQLSPTPRPVGLPPPDFVSTYPGMHGSESVSITMSMPEPYLPLNTQLKAHTGRQDPKPNKAVMAQPVTRPTSPFVPPDEFIHHPSERLHHQSQSFSQLPQQQQPPQAYYRHEYQHRQSASQSLQRLY